MGCEEQRYEGQRCEGQRCEKENLRHVHEFLGSTKIVGERTNEVHNHRFAGVTGEGILCKDSTGRESHLHRIVTRTDNFNDHFHVIDVCTGPAIPVGNGARHVHYVFACTRDSDGHRHMFRIATLIENPTGDSEYC